MRLSGNAPSLENNIFSFFLYFCNHFPLFALDRALAWDIMKGKTFTVIVQILTLSNPVYDGYCMWHGGGWLYCTNLDISAPKRARELIFLYIFYIYPLFLTSKRDIQNHLKIETYEGKNKCKDLFGLHFSGNFIFSILNAFVNLNK